MNLVIPHGGLLVDRFVAEADLEAFGDRAARLPAIRMDAREQADLELIAVGAASPLAGFLGRADYERVLADMRLTGGDVWPLPLTLAVADDTRDALAGSPEAALHDATGRLWGTVRVADLFERDPLAEAAAVYGTTDDTHPGVAYLLNRPRWLVGGEVRVVPLPADLPFADRRLTPRALRAEIAARGWRRVAGFQTRNPIHRAHEHLTKLALEMTDGLVVHPLVGDTKRDDVPATVRFRAYEALLERYYPADRVVLAAFPAAMRYAGPREALFHAIVRKNYGITHLIVGRDHAGVGKFYGPYDAQRLFDRFTEAEIGVAPLRMDPTFYCRTCDALASVRTCPHEPADRVELSGSRVREMLAAGEDLPREFSRREVAAVLREHYQRDAPGRPAATAGRAAQDAGAAAPILWFTGLSGAGKSTLAEALRLRLGPTRRLEVLDGDEVRTNLSKGLGFSREDRDTNIRRIGFVARLLARHGVTVITAAISPYAAIRDEVRRLAERDGVRFVEVFVSASIEALVRRDVKGLYRKALAGELPHFTGISDPYEAPATPDVVVHTDRESIDESVSRILAALDAAPQPAAVA